MGWLVRLFRRGQEEPYDLEWLIDHADLGWELQKFVRTETWSDARRILEHHPELLSDDAARIMARAQVKGDASARRSLKVHRAFLTRCREVGIDTAFAEFTGEAKAPEKLSGFGVILVAFYDRDTDEEGSGERHAEVMAQRIATSLAAQLSGVWNDMILHKRMLPVAIISLPGLTYYVQRALDSFHIGGGMTAPPVSVYPIEYIEPNRQDEAARRALVPVAKIPGQVMTWIDQYHIKTLMVTYLDNHAASIERDLLRYVCRCKKALVAEVASTDITEGPLLGYNKVLDRATFMPTDDYKSQHYTPASSDRSATGTFYLCLEKIDCDEPAWIGAVTSVLRLLSSSLGVAQRHAIEQAFCELVDTLGVTPVEVPESRVT